MNLNDLRKNSLYTYIINTEIDNNSTFKNVIINLPSIIQIEKVYIQAINNSSLPAIVNVSGGLISQDEVINTKNHLGTLIIKDNYQSQIEININHLFLRNESINITLTKPSTTGKVIANVLIYYRYVYE